MAVFLRLEAGFASSTYESSEDEEDPELATEASSESSSLSLPSSSSDDDPAAARRRGGAGFFAGTDDSFLSFPEALRVREKRTSKSRSSSLSSSLSLLLLVVPPRVMVLYGSLRCAVGSFLLVCMIGESCGHCSEERLSAMVGRMVQEFSIRHSMADSIGMGVRLDPGLRINPLALFY